MTTHLSDDRLIEMCFDVEDRASDRAHLVDCVDCRERQYRIVETLDGVEMALGQQADEAFPPDRLARQRARILSRVEQDGRPARVIAFPTSYSHETTAPRRLRATRWGAVAAAVAASFVLGLLASDLAQDLPGSHQLASQPLFARQATVAAPAILTVHADDELLGQVELAATGVGPSVLRPLDQLTPRGWNVR